MRDTFSRLEITGTVRNDDIFSRDEERNLPSKVRVVVDLLEGVTRETQAPQHPLMFRAILFHHVGQLVVHVSSDTNRSFLLLRGLLADNLRLDRTSGGERTHHGLGLELDQCFGKQGVVYTTRPRPRLGAVFDLQTKQL